jgi:hypothetical protein
VVAALVLAGAGAVFAAGPLASAMDAKAALAKLG